MKKYIVVLFSVLLLFPIAVSASPMYYYKDSLGIEHGDKNSKDSSINPNLGTTANLGFISLILCEAEANRDPLNSNCYSSDTIDVTNFSPLSGKAGDTVTIEGKNFSGIKKVFFKTVEASVVSVSPTQIKVTIPSSRIATGQISVVSQWRSWDTSSGTFQVLGDDGKPIDVNKETNSSATNSENKSVYNLIAPIGSLKCIDTAKLDPNCAKGGIGDYLNLMVRLGIGLCAALSVLLLVINGFMYMGDESVFGKTEAKSKILACFLGLTISLGAYALLNTINPELVGSGGISIEEAEITIDEDDNETEPLATDGSVSIPSGRIAQCKEGIITVSTSGGVFHACKTISDKFKEMIDNAWKAGFKISGSGFRTYEQQVSLRKKNCGTSQAQVYTNPADSCKPPTARPGYSMHESGLAFDLQCDGSGIKSRSNRCFVWLSNNASKYGFSNLKTEAWHWSTTGK